MGTWFGLVGIISTLSTCLIAALLVWGLLGWPGKPVAYRWWGSAWFVVVPSANVLWPFMGAAYIGLNLGQILEPHGGPIDNTFQLAATLIGSQLLVWVTWASGLWLALRLARHLDWPAVARKAGWRLDGWRRWLVVLVTITYLSWPVGLLTVLIQLGLDWIRGQQTGGQLNPYPLATLVSNWVALLVAALAANRVLGFGWAGPHDRLADGSAAARRLLFIGLTGVLSVGLGTLISIGVRSIAWDSGLSGRPNEGQPPVSWLELGVLLAPLLLIGRIDWRRLRVATGGHWPIAARALAALTLGSWLSWPLDAGSQLLGAGALVGQSTLAMVGLVVLVAIGVAWMMRYRPTVPETE
jgi:hypothetical protein